MIEPHDPCLSEGERERERGRKVIILIGWIRMNDGLISVYAVWHFHVCMASTVTTPIHA